MLHPAEGRCIVSSNTEHKPIGGGDGGVAAGVHVDEYKHEEEDIDDNTNELMDVDVVLWGGWVWR